MLELDASNGWIQNGKGSKRMGNSFIWVGLFDILIKNKVINNYYEFKHNLPLSKSNGLGFARCEGRKIHTI